MLSFLQTGDKVATSTGETATIIDARDGHLLDVTIAGRGALVLHEDHILGYATTSYNRRGEPVAMIVPFAVRD